ncbi:MAG: hypothetical protein G01um101425_280 [Candidatus Peregrinibacteria bacterium Gr01-1014_25]|nr:MAG: hypothetical protein G01um101425_280 [Candidatus Peregrinibacteria bacterium Gr01-1014_25]
MPTFSPHAEGLPDHDLLGDIDEQLTQTLLQESPADYVLQAYVLIEQVTGKSIGTQGELYDRGEGMMRHPDAPEALRTLRNGLARVSSHLPFQKETIQWYVHLIDESLQTLLGSEAQRARREGSYEMELGSLSTTMTGEGFENALLYPNGAPPIRPKSPTDVEHLPEREAIDDAMATSPYAGRPWDPDAEWLADVTDVTSRQLKLDAIPVEEAQRCIAAVPCIGRALDVRYGVDCFVRYVHPETGREAIVTLDLTTDVQRKLTEGFKADILITPEGAYLHPDLVDAPRLRVVVDDIEHGAGLIDAAHARDRRVRIGTAIGQILEWKTHMPETERCRLRMPNERKAGGTTRQRLASVDRTIRRRLRRATGIDQGSYDVPDEG